MVFRRRRTQPNKLKRWLFANSVSLITLLTIAYQAGILKEKIDTQAETIVSIVRRLTDFEGNMNAFALELSNVKIERNYLCPRRPTPGPQQ